MNINPMNNHFVFITVIAAIFSLTGCSNLAHKLYAPPTSGEVAHLRIEDVTGRGLPGNFLIATFEKPENCERRIFLQGIASQLKQTAVSLDFMNIEAGKTFPLMVSVPMGGDFRGYKSCTLAVSFLPESGRFYTAIYSTDEEKNMCYLTLRSTETASSLNKRPEKFKRLTRKVGFDENSSWCSSD